MMFLRIREWFGFRERRPVISHDHPLELSELERRLGYRFQNRDLLVQSLKHRSYLGTTGEARHAANERMEFLGDAVLDLIVSEYIYRRDENANEGKLTQIKCSIVSGRMLAKISEEIGIGEFILLSEGEAKAGGRHRNSILEDAFEAVLGAIYLDGGIGAAETFLHQIVLKQFDQLDMLEPYSNNKSELLEWAQNAGLGAPRYNVLQEEGPEHNKLFHIEVEVGGRRLAVGQGHSKKQAEQNAAKYAIEWLQQNPFSAAE